MIGCEHLTADICPTCNKKYHANLKSLYLDLKTNSSYNDKYAMKLIIAYADILVKTYQLTECDELINETMDWVNANLNNTDKAYLQYIQSVAVLRFKQKRFVECAEQYEIVRSVLGDSYAIYENLAHVYNSCNDLTKAADCINRALELAESESRKAGLYLALGVNMCARNKINDALTYALKAMNIYDTQTSSTPKEYPTLSAKARMSVAKYYEQLNDLPNALKYYSEAATTFTTTCGLINPLTFDALKNQGYVLAALHKWSDAISVLTNTLNIGTKLDAKCIDQSVLCQISKVLIYAKKMK
jgi:tetratricopeptide (TPR) repeat protein